MVLSQYRECRGLRLFVFVILGIATIIVAVVVAGTIYVSTAPELSAQSEEFTFKYGRLWAAVRGSHEEYGLVDTGTTTSVFSNKWHLIHLESDRAKVETLFSRIDLPVGRLESLQIGGESFEADVLMADVPYPIIGADYLFDRGPVLLSKNGLIFNKEYDHNEALACAKAEPNFYFDIKKDAVAVNSVYFLLSIDGTDHKVLFDTGNENSLEASALVPMPNNKPFPWPNIRYNMFGEYAFSPFFMREAHLKLGGITKRLPYKHYFADNSSDFPFVMGAGILEHFSILIDVKKERVCFFGLNYGNGSR